MKVTESDSLLTADSCQASSLPLPLWTHIWASRFKSARTPSFGAHRKSVHTSPFSHTGVLTLSPAPRPTSVKAKASLLALSQAMFWTAWEPPLLSLESLLMWERSIFIPSWCMCSITCLGLLNQLRVGGGSSHLWGVTTAENCEARRQGKGKGSS